MDKQAVNPWSWSLAMGYNQGEVVSGASRTLYLAGQTAIDGDGTPQHEGDLPAQVSLALDNVEAVLAAAGMGLANLVRLTIYTTDVDGLMQVYGEVLGARLAAAGATPPATLLGVARLALPSLLVELEATAVA